MDKKHVKICGEPKACWSSDKSKGKERGCQKTETKTSKTKEEKAANDVNGWPEKGKETEFSVNGHYSSHQPKRVGEEQKKSSKMERKKSSNVTPSRKGSISKKISKSDVKTRKLSARTPIITVSSLKRLRERLEKIVNALCLIEEKQTGKTKRKKGEQEAQKSGKKRKKSSLPPPPSTVLSPSSSSISSYHSDAEPLNDVDRGGGAQNGYMPSSPPLRSMGENNAFGGYYYDTMIASHSPMSNVEGGREGQETLEKALPDLSDLYSDFSSEFSSVSGRDLKTGGGFVN